MPAYKSAEAIACDKIRAALRDLYVGRKIKVISEILTEILLGQHYFSRYRYLDRLIMAVGESLRAAEKRDMARQAGSSDAAANRMSGSAG